MSAEAAAGHWQGSRLRLITARENAVYEIRLPGGERAALRLHRPGYQSAAAISSELWWCAALAKAGVPVAAPIAALDGRLVVDLGGGAMASVVAWVDGAPIGKAGVALPGNAEQQAQIHFDLGRLLARIHAVTDGLVLPDGFTRPAWDAAGLVGDVPFWNRFWEHPALTEREASKLRAARDLLGGMLAEAGRTQSFGMIHADVLRENVFMNDGSLALIDFDDAGFGFRLYDLGTVMSQNLYQPNRDELRAALIDGYQDGAGLSAETVDLFTLARVCASVGWTMTRLAPDDPIHRSHIERALMWFGTVAG